MKRRRVTYRPSKAQGIFGVVWGGIFVLIGLVVVIPTFGPFGILWTLIAVGITVMNGLHAFGTRYVGPEIRIEDEEDGEEVSRRSPETHDHTPSPAPDVKGRLEQLKSLKEAGLLTKEEYEQKREEILKDL